MDAVANLRSDECYTPDERFEPILSRRARKETPRPGSNASPASLDTTHNTFLKSAQVNTLIPLLVPPVEEPANSIHVDSVLYEASPEILLRI